MKVHIVFSSIKSPVDTVVHQSLQKFKEVDGITVVTSKKFSQEWLISNCGVQIAKYDSTSKSRVTFRKFLWRSSMIRRLTRIAIHTFFAEDRQVLMPPHNARHFEYLRAMESFSAKDWVILVDSRDLIFQNSPKEIIKKLDTSVPIHLFLEDGKFFKDGAVQTNEKSPANWNWAAQLLNFDLEKMKSLEGTEIVNSGCVIGRVSELRDFFKKSCDLLSTSLHSSYALLDQASVNVLAYCSGDKLGIASHKNGKIVLNMCGVIKEKVSLKAGELLVDGNVVSIVHQFDRFGTWDVSTGLRFDKREYKVQQSPI